MMVTGAAVSKSFRRMREPVTTTSVVSVSAASVSAASFLAAGSLAGLAGCTAGVGGTGVVAADWAKATCGAAATVPAAMRTLIQACIERFIN
jgi:hypothetical protein